MPDDQAQDGGAGQQDAGQGQPQKLEEWLAAQSAETQAVFNPLLETHVQGLKSALESERGTRKDLEKQVRDLAGKAEKGSDAETQLTQLADTVAAAERKADFMEAAHAAGVTNLKLAYTVAVQDEMFDKHGRLNFEAMKTQYPELFGARPAAPGHAGSGTGAPPPAGGDMNAFLRRSAGVG